MDLSEVKTSFQHLYAAAKSDEPIELTANWDGTCIHLPESGMGHIWKIVHSLFPANLEFQHVKKALQSISLQFQQAHKKVLDECTEYSKQLSLKCQEFPCNEDAFGRARVRLIEWHDATRPFLKLLENPKNPLVQVFHNYMIPQDNAREMSPLASTMIKIYKVCRALIRFLVHVFTHLCLPYRAPQTLFDAKPKFNLPPFTLPNNKELYSHLDLIRWERASQIDTPYVGLYKICMGKTLSKEDEAELKKWIVKIEKSDVKHKVGLFHRALKAFLVQTKGTTLLGDVEYALFERGCQFLCEDDKKFLEKRKLLKKGDSIEFNGKQVELGIQLGKKSFGQDRNVFFSLPYDPNKVLWISRNSSLIPIEMRKSELSGWGIRAAKILEIDSLGRYALVERLAHPLHKYKWSSADGKKLTPEDEARAAPLANQLKWFVDNNLTPDNLSLRNLMFNQEGVLKSSHVLHPKELNLNILEDVVKETKNSTIFAYLMLHSGLSDLPHAHFYQKLVQEFLEGKVVEVKLKSYANEIDDPMITQRATILLYKIGELKKKAAEKICDEYRVLDQELLSKILSESILKFYKQTHAAGTLWPHITKDLISHVVQLLKLKPKKREEDQTMFDLNIFEN